MLVTKGRLGGKEPVVLLPTVEHVLLDYILRHRPHGQRLARPGDRQTTRQVDRQAVFLSHSTYRYGQRISGETVRSVLDTLRLDLDEPWRTRLHPHLLRHAWGYDLQRLDSPLGLTANMRHRSPASAKDYRAGPELWQAELSRVDAAAADMLRAIAPR